jgi:hypothetical protein
MKRNRLLTALIVGSVFGGVALMFWIYPFFFRYLQKQDCIAAGYTSCGLP